MGRTTYSLGSTSNDGSSVLSTAENSENYLNGLAGTYDPVKVELLNFNKSPTTANLIKQAAASTTKNAVIPTAAETARKVPPEDTGLFGMKNSTVGGIADVGNLAVSAFAAYDGYKTAKLNRKALQFNLDTAKAEQARRNSNVSGFNSFGSSAPAQTAMA
tara:strand:- start:55 stop:534 length:480 start_codon:yes stop_codon:yes gene_type:complete